MDKITGRLKPMYLIYAMGIFYNLHVAIPTFINSTFLAEFTKEETVGLVFTIGSILTLFAIIGVFRLLPRHGNRKLAIALILIDAASLVGLAVFTGPVLLTVSFLVYFVMTTLIAFNIDIFFESFAPTDETGQMRGAYLALANAAWLVAPLLAGFLATGERYDLIYLTTLVFLAPLLALIFYRFKKFEDHSYENMHLKESFWNVWNFKDVRHIFLANLVLQTYFAWMVVYTPLYMHDHLGMSFSEIGIILTAMLSAYVLFEYPLGRLADKVMGEKELLIMGFLFAGFAGLLLATSNTTNIWWWISVLFVSRVGAAAVEVMSESYFFKKISGADTADLSLFRMTRPLGYIIGPIIGSAFLLYFDMRWIFIVAGLAAFSGIYFAAKIHDTK